METLGAVCIPEAFSQKFLPPLLHKQDNTVYRQHLLDGRKPDASWSHIRPGHEATTSYLQSCSRHLQEVTIARFPVYPPRSSACSWFHEVLPYPHMQPCIQMDAQLLL